MSSGSMEAATSLASSTYSPTFTTRVWTKPIKSLRYPGLSSLFPPSRNQLSLKCSLNVPNEKPFGVPGKVKTHVERVIKRLWEIFPEPVKEFPLKSAEEMVLQRLLNLGQRSLKWALITLFAASSLSDVIFAISTNRELLIPVGLFLGCVMTDFFKETSQELFPITQEEGLSWHLFGIGLIFVAIKSISLNLATPGRVLLSHVGNGGLMQALWLGKKLQEGANDDQSKKQTPGSS